MALMTSAQKTLAYKRTNGQFSGITVEGTSSSTLVSNAAKGKTAYDGTSQYRTGTTLPYVSISTSYRVIANYPDPQSAYVELFWDYTQGTNKVSQFVLTISDGTAIHVLRVLALALATAVKYKAIIHRMPMNKSITVSLSSEFSTAAGVITRGDGTLWSFTTSGNVGSSPSALNVGELDWAGGNVWFDTEQYRNNYPPTNAPGGSFSITTSYVPGANQLYLTLANLSYTQGANIATHIAVILRQGGGTISLTADHIVTLINVASIPSSFTIPYSLIRTMDYTVGIAAVALTKNGYSFNNTVRSVTITGVFVLDIYGAGLSGVSGATIRLMPGSGAKVYVSNILSVAGDVELSSGKVVKINGDQIIGARGAAVANATDAASVIARLNDLLSRCRAHGLIAT